MFTSTPVLNFVIMACRFRLFFLLSGAFIIFGIALCCLFSQTDIFLAINGMHHPLADRIFMLLTNLGDGLFMATTGLVLLAIRVRFAVLTMLSLLVTGLVAQLIKRALALPRPAKFFANQESIYLIPDYPVHIHNAFPSGHTTTAFSLALVLTYVLAQIGRTERFWSCLAVATALIVGYSRVYLAQHFFGDVLAGALLGTGLTLVLIHWMERSGWSHTNWMMGRVDPFWFLKNRSASSSIRKPAAPDLRMPR